MFYNLIDKLTVLNPDYKVIGFYYGDSEVIATTASFRDLMLPQGWHINRFGEITNYDYDILRSCQVEDKFILSSGITDATMEAFISLKRNNRGLKACLYPDHEGNKFNSSYIVGNIPFNKLKLKSTILNFNYSYEPDHHKTDFGILAKLGIVRNSIINFNK